MCGVYCMHKWAINIVPNICPPLVADCPERKDGLREEHLNGVIILPPNSNIDKWNYVASLYEMKVSGKGVSLSG